MKIWLKCLLVFVLLLGAGHAAQALLRKGGSFGSSGPVTPQSVHFTPAPVAQPIPVQPQIFDTDADNTQVAAVNVTMTSGSFSGTLGFQAYSGSDLVLDSTTSTYGSSASHAFANRRGGTDGVVTCNISFHNSIASASFGAFTSADVGYQLRIYDMTGLPYPNSTWSIIYLNGTQAELNHEGTSTACPAPNGTTSVKFYVEYSSDIFNVINVTGGSGCTVGSYEIQQVRPDGKAVVDRSMGTPGSTCTWTMTMDGGGHYQLSGSNIKTKSSSTNLFPRGNRIGTVEITATQNSVTAVGVLPITTITDYPYPYEISDYIGNLPGQDVNCNDVGGGGCIGEKTNGYSLNLQLANGLGSVNTTQSGLPTWTNIGGDWYGCTTSTGNAPCTVSQGTVAYDTFSSTVVCGTVGICDQTWTFNGAGMALLINDITATDDGMSIILRMPSPRQIYSCNGQYNAALRPSLTVTYNDASTEVLACKAAVAMGNTDTEGIVQRQPTEVTGNSTQQIGLAFRRPSKSLTITAATMTVISAAQFTGTATISVQRVKVPRTAPIGGGYADGYPLDSGIGADSHTYFYFPLDGTDFSTRYVENPSPSYDYTCLDSTKYPLKNYNKIINTAPDGSLNGVIFYTTAPTPIDGSYTGYGYYPFNASIPEAWLVSGILGQSNMMDWHIFMKPTATGNQSTACVDGSGGNIAAGKVIPVGRMPDHVSLRYNVMLLGDFLSPPYDLVPSNGSNSGKFGFAFSNGRFAVCGNGGAACDGLNGWSSRGQWTQFYNPNTSNYSMVGVGGYFYNRDIYQYNRMAKLPLSPLTWHSVEYEWFNNTYSDVGSPTVASATLYSGGVACPSGTYIISGGTGTAARLVVTSSGSTAVSATVSGSFPGNYTIAPAPNPASFTTGCDAKFNLRMTDQSVPNGYVKMYIDDELVLYTTTMTWNSTPPFTKTPSGDPGLEWPPSTGGVAQIWANHYCGGVAGCIGNPMHYAINHLVVSDGTHIGPVKIP